MLNGSMASHLEGKALQKHKNVREEAGVGGR